MMPGENGRKGDQHHAERQRERETAARVPRSRFARPTHPRSGPLRAGAAGSRRRRPRRPARLVGAPQVGNLTPELADLSVWALAR